VSGFVQSWAEATWSMIYESALLLLIGFLLAGLIRSFLSPLALQRLFGRGQLGQIFKASLIGIPLPLCSCSVLPVAAQLRKSGLSREGTISFLISTPETGVDSIALSYNLLGPVFTIIRPLAALLVAFSSGLVSLIFNPGYSTPAAPLDSTAVSAEDKRFFKRVIEGQRFVIQNLLPELSYYLFWGFLLAGLAAALIPHDLIRAGVPNWIQYAAVIAVSVPVYVCATSSTPFAAVLLGLGLMPGAVLAFLLVGPATNLTSLAVQRKILGLRSTVIMTISIVVAAIGLGLLFDLILGSEISSIFSGQTTEGAGVTWYSMAAASLLIWFMLYYTFKHLAQKVSLRLATK
jgi:uncharacterized membrane protein YraQ (UPF0718 family)